MLGEGDQFPPHAVFFLHYSALQAIVVLLCFPLGHDLV